MKEILINNKTIAIKDHYCCPCEGDFESTDGTGYYLHDDPGLWLYINITDRCNADCPFCANGDRNLTGSIDPAKFHNALQTFSQYVSGVSFTGGEPMLDPLLLCTLIGIADELVDRNVEFDMVTNGTNLERLPFMPVLSRLSTIHISRHAIDDYDNRKIMKWNEAPTWKIIRKTAADLSDPGAVVLNCVLQKGGVQNMEDVCAYLDKAIEAGIQNTSFITMMPANTFCIDNHIDPDTFAVMTEDGVRFFNNTHDSKITVWNRMRDHDYCRCLSGTYETTAGRTRFYFRCPGGSRAEDYCRQLVYTAGNTLQDGFGNNSRCIIR